MIKFPKLKVILPMRQGSRRVKNKNILPLCGLPLYRHMVNTLLACPHVEHIIINTDIKKIRRLSHPKISLITRPPHLRGNCDINRVLADTLKRTAGDYFLQVHATNPLLTPQTIERAITIFFKNLRTHDSLLAVTEVRKRFWRRNGTPINFRLSAPPTTQSLAPYFEENSCLYIFSRTSFEQRRNRIGRHPYLFVIGSFEAIDIDTADDFKTAEAALRQKQSPL